MLEWSRKDGEKLAHDHLTALHDRDDLAHACGYPRSIDYEA